MWIICLVKARARTLCGISGEADRALLLALEDEGSAARSAGWVWGSRVCKFPD